MATSNPAFSQSPAFQNGSGAGARAPRNFRRCTSAPSATSVDTDRMTVEDTIVKTAISFAFLLAGAAVGWSSRHCGSPR